MEKKRAFTEEHRKKLSLSAKKRIGDHASCWNGGKKGGNGKTDTFGYKAVINATR